MLPRSHGHARATQGWQVPEGSVCLLLTPGELTPVPVPPSCSAGRCFWHFLPCAFSDLNSATATWSLHVDGAIECCHRCPGAEPGDSKAALAPSTSLSGCKRGTYSWGMVSAVPSLRSNGHTKASHQLLLPLKHKSPGAPCPEESSPSPHRRCPSPAASVPRSQADSELRHSQWVSPLLPSRGRFPSSGLLAHKSGAELSLCHSTGSPWHAALSGSGLLPLRNAACSGLVLLHFPAGMGSRTALGKALQKGFERNVLVRCRNPPSSARGPGGSPRAAEGTDTPERQGWE